MSLLQVLKQLRYLPRETLGSNVSIAVLYCIVLLVCAAGFRPHKGLFQPTFNEGELILFMNDFFIRDFQLELN